MSKQVKNFFHLLSSDVLSRMIWFVSFIIFARYLKKEEIAFLAYFNMLGGLSTLVFSFGVLPVFVKELPEKLGTDMKQAKALINTGVSFLFCSVLVFACCVYIFSKQINLLLTSNEIYEVLFTWMVPGLFFLGVRKINEYLLWANSRFRETAILRVSEAILKSAIGIPCVIVLGVKGLILGLVTAELFCSGMSIFFLRDILFYPCFKFYSAKELFKNSWPYYLEGYFNYFLSQGDNWIITTCLGPQTLGVYYVAKRFYMFFFMAGKSLDKIITTKLAMNKSDKNKISSSIKHIILRISQLVTPASLFFIGLIPALIYAAFGPKYMGAVVPCIILCLSVVVQMYFYPIRRGIFILLPSMTRFKIAVLETIIVIAALLIFAPAWKINGIALSWLIGRMAAGLITYFILKKGLDLRLPLKESLLSLSISSTAAYVLIACQVMNFDLVFLPLYVCGSAILFIILSKVTGAGIHSDIIKFIKNPKEI